MPCEMTQLVAMVQQSGSADLAAFRQDFGEAFLLYTGKAEDLRVAKKAWQPTVDPHGRRVGKAAPADLARLLVYPLPDASVEPWSATVGRVDPNNVVIPDESVSVFHAIFSRGKGGQFLLQDAGSTNGTFINDQPVLPREYNKPARVCSNDAVRFGSVVLTFLLPAEVLDLVQVLAAVTQSPAAKESSSLHSSELFGEVKRGSTGSRPLSQKELSLLEAVQQLERGRFRVAIEQLGAIAAQQPGNRTARIWLHVAEARQKRDMDDIDGSVQAYREVLALDPSHAEALRELRIAWRGTKR